MYRPKTVTVRFIKDINIENHKYGYDEYITIQLRLFLRSKLHHCISIIYYIVQ